MLADPRGGLRLIASSDERMRLLELFELQGAQGPCLDAFSSGRAVQASAADSRARWPVFAPEASDAGFQMMCAVPLRVRTDVIGALNLFRGSDEPFTGTEMEIAQAMAEMAAIGLIQERALRERSLLAEQLQVALNSRVIIEQAKGMLAEYLAMSVDDAFRAAEELRARPQPQALRGRRRHRQPEDPEGGTDHAARSVNQLLTCGECETFQLLRTQGRWTPHSPTPAARPGRLARTPPPCRRRPKRSRGRDGRSRPSLHHHPAVRRCPGPGRQAIVRHTGHRAAHRLGGHGQRAGSSSTLTAPVRRESFTASTASSQRSSGKRCVMTGVRSRPSATKSK